MDLRKDMGDRAEKKLGGPWRKLAIQLGGAKRRGSAKERRKLQERLGR